MAQPTASQIENTIEIDATPQRVWEIVSDLAKAPEWSDQAWKVFPIGSTRNGTFSININRQNGFIWPTTSRVVDFEPGRRIANRIYENTVVWAFELEPTADGGTRLIERRETPTGISALSKFLTKAFFGGPEKFTETLEGGVSLSLQRIKRLAERG